jgi:isoleucyl-tRNA synthetase
MSLQAQPFFSALGPKHGGEVNRVADAIRSLGQDELRLLQTGSTVKITVDGTGIEIESGDVILEEVEPEGLAVEREGEVTVAIDTRLDESLIREGLAREFTTRVQNLRRQVGYEVTDRIRLAYQATAGLEAAIEAHAEYIIGEALVIDLHNGAYREFDRQDDWRIEDESVTICVAKA